MSEIKCSLSTFGFQMMPAPGVQAFCYLPRIKHGEWVHFLIDTGSSGTCLNGVHAVDLQKQLLSETCKVSYGIGGNCQYYHERAVLLFRDIQGQLLPRILILGIQCIQEPDLKDVDSLQCPSLLGRDILNDWTLNYIPHQSTVTLIVP